LHDFENIKVDPRSFLEKTYYYLSNQNYEKYTELEITNIVSSVVDRVLSIISSSDTYNSPDILSKIAKECEKGIEMTKRFQ
jgi:hypothetical protein